MSEQATELYRKYRPERISEVVGQDEALTQLKEMARTNTIPHFILFQGPSGTGKTTLIRILRNRLKCADADFNEINASDERGIGMVRELLGNIRLAPMAGPCRVYLIDECQALTPDAQNSFLKILEDTPSHVYFFFATTDPEKLKRTILTRATVITCKPIKDADMAALIKRVATAENTEVADDVVEKIVEAADGSARSALVMLHAVIGIKDHTAQLNAIESTEAKATGFRLAQEICRKGASWKAVSAILADIHTGKEDPDDVRRIVLGYARSILVNKGDAHAALVIEEFRDNLWETKHAGLAVACWNVVQAYKG